VARYKRVILKNPIKKYYTWNRK